jgi:[amino group carrier protein]-lysine/ornithine hydrolase
VDSVALLREMLETPSLSGEERAIAELLVRRMGEAGFAAHIDDAGNAVGVMGDGPEEILLLGHMDTVPGEIPVRIEEGTLHGRGAVDAKGPLATFISAVSRVGPLPGKSLVVIGAVEEECATSAGARHVSGSHHPAMTIIGEPSNWDRITLGYKGSLVVQYTVVQAGEHTSGPTMSANERAVDFWFRAREYARQRNGDAPRSFQTLDSALRAMYSSDDGLYQYGTVVFSYRVPLGITIDELERELGSWADEGELTIVSAEPPFKAERNTALVRAFLQAIREEGGRPRFAVKHGTSDMNIVGPAWGGPILAYGPGDSNLDHTPYEQIELAEYEKGIAVLERVLRLL